MELIIWKKYNYWIYLWKDLVIDWIDVIEEYEYREIFFKDWCITWDYYKKWEILEDNIDMLPKKIYYDYEEYICLIDIVDEGEWLLWRLSYITNYGKVLFEIFNDSYIDIVEVFNKRKESVEFPQEIRYIY